MDDEPEVSVDAETHSACSVLGTRKLRTAETPPTRGGGTAIGGARDACSAAKCWLPAVAARGSRGLSGSLTYIAAREPSSSDHLSQKSRVQVFSPTLFPTSNS